MRTDAYNKINLMNCQEGREIKCRGREIECRRGLRHADLLSSLLFVFVADDLRLMIRKVEQIVLVSGLAGACTTNYTNLQYADDILIFGDMT